jgi:hypothetical protein
VIADRFRIRGEVVDLSAQMVINNDFGGNCNGGDARGVF